MVYSLIAGYQHFTYVIAYTTLKNMNSNTLIFAKSMFKFVMFDDVPPWLH